MLGLCTICGDPVADNQQYCITCQAELDAAFEVRRREVEADTREIARWLAGDNIERGAVQSNHETKPIRQPEPNRRWGRRGGK